EKQYEALVRRMEEAINDRRPEDVEGLHQEAIQVNKEDPRAHKLLEKAKKILARYDRLVEEARRLMEEHRYNRALGKPLREVEKLRRRGSHVKMKQEAEDALKKRKQLEEQIKQAAKDERWKEVKRLGLELQRSYPERPYPEDAYPEDIKKPVGYAKALIEAEKCLKVENMGRACDWLRKAKSYRNWLEERNYKIGTKKEGELERRWRLHWIVDGFLVHQKVVDVGGEVVCVAGAPDSLLFLAGLTNGRFVVVSVDCKVKHKFTPPRKGMKPVAAAFVKGNFLLLWSDGSLQMRRNNGLLILSKRLPKPIWACSLGNAVIMWDGEKLWLLEEKQRWREMPELRGARPLCAGRFLVFRKPDGKIVLVDPYTLRVKSQFSVVGEVASCATSEKMVALGLKSGIIELRRLSRKVVKPVKPLRSSPTVLLFDRTGDFLFAMDYLDVVLIRVSTGQVLWSKRLKCWVPAGAAIVGLNDALAICDKAGKLILILPSRRP
ncbi:MAG: hypothetical protein DRP63_05305, partial [Planctomycetota bacterium]